MSKKQPQRTNTERTHVEHVGWMAHELGDEVARRLRESDFELVEQAFVWSFLRKGDSFLDLGAHFGLYSAIAAQIVGDSGRVVAVEPNPRSFRLLRENLGPDPNGRLTLIEGAIWLHDGTMQLSAGIGQQAAFSRLLPPSLKKTGVGVTTHTIPAILRKSGLARVDLVKLDMEGAELAALHSLGKTRAPEFLGCLLIEFTEENLRSFGSTGEELWRKLTSLGYTLCRFIPASRKLVVVDHLPPVDHANYVAVADVAKANRRLASSPVLQCDIANDLLARYSAVSAVNRSRLQSNSEQASLIAVLRGEIQRLETEAKAAQKEVRRATTSAQKHIDALKAQLDQLAATSKDQTKHIAVLEKERDRLTTETKAAQTEANRASKDGQKHIDALKTQLDQLAATSSEQTKHINVLEKERDRLAKELGAANKEAARAVADGQKHIDALKRQLDDVASSSREQAEFIATLKREQKRTTDEQGELQRKADSYIATIKEQTAYIKALEAVRDQNSDKRQ